jgi:flagellar biosynthesis anti-sigma factor FlgM
MTDAISQFANSPQVNSPVRNAQEKNSSAAVANSDANHAVAAKTAANAPSPATTAQAEASSGASAGADTVVLSTAAQVVAKPNTASSDGVFDRNKVDSIKTAIKNGQYAIDPSRVAQSFWSIEQMIHG